MTDGIVRPVCRFRIFAAEFSFLFERFRMRQLHPDAAPAVLPDVG